MRIMIDTNIIVSALLFSSHYMNEMLRTIVEKHKLVLSSFVIDELLAVVQRKSPQKQDAVDRFLSRFPYEMVYTPKEIVPHLFHIRDEKDYPVLYTAMLEDVDILITNDKDFFDIQLERPEILTPQQFLEK
ncbi:putative toxin-antitoxin system toxin component, PIN family [Paenibacillus elgii]|uniref:putative toxin-antitoxin system toxin component, PIN family n=1 Tax=Paenibacillus elgii TaxID=189691 RepID=UPI0013D18CE1|nr:putative toxin-antitoxin system toxin component, PIN family [Paenibacillus elgii]